VTAIVAGVVVAGATKYLRFDTPRAAPGPSGAPLLIDSVELPTTRDGYSFAFERPPRFTVSDLTTAQNLVGEDAEFPWWRRHGGIDVDILSIRTVVRGNAAAQTRILDMSVLPRCTGPLPTGAIASTPGAGAENVQNIGFDLDKTRPYAQIESDGTFGGAFFDKKNITLDRNETTTFRITAKSFRRDCRFTIRIETITKGKKYTAVLDDHGRPFRVTGHYERPHQDVGTHAPVFPRYREVYINGVELQDTTPRLRRASGRELGWAAVDPKKFCRCI